MISGISDRSLFSTLRADGLHVRSADLRVRYLPRSGFEERTETPQVAYSISRKVGNAVVRNRIRRRLRSLFVELLDDESPLLSAAVVIVLPGARDRTYAALRDQVMELMKKMEKSAGTPV